MATITKVRLKDGKARYRARVRVAGYPDKTATFDLKGDAKAWAAKVEADMQLARYHPEGLASRYTLAEAIDKYLRELQASGKNRARYFAIKKAQLMWWRRELGDYRLSLLTPFALNEKKVQLLEEGRSPSTVNRYLASLSHCLSVACKSFQWIMANPVRAIERLREPRGRVRFLSDDERKALLKACAEICPDLFDVVVLGVCTGARKNELLSLRWADVSIERGVAIAQETKNGERRQLHITNLALDIIMRRASKRRRGAVYVFASRTESTPLNIDRQWRKARKKARIRDFRFHDLRHCFSSYAAMNGATLMDLKDALGHKTLAMVTRYTHLCDTHVAGVVGTMTAKVFEGMEARP